MRFVAAKQDRTRQQPHTHSSFLVPKRDNVAVIIALSFKKSKLDSELADMTDKEQLAQNSANMAKIFSFVVLIVVIVVIGALFYKVMRMFFLPLFLAALMVVIFKPVHRWIYERCGHRKRLAALFTTAAILIVVLLPLGWGLALAINEGVEIITSDPAAKIEGKLNEFRQAWGLAMPYQGELEQFAAATRKLAPRDDDEAARRITPAEAERIEQLRANFENVLDAKVAAPETSDRDRIQAIRARDQLYQMPSQELESFVLKAEKNAWTPESEMPYQSAAHRVEVRYQTFRQELLGGLPRAWFTDLANPSAARLDSWRAQAIRQLRGWLLSVTGHTTQLLASLLLGISIMIISIYYFLIDGAEMIVTGMRLSPLDDKYEMELLTEFDKVSRAVVLATLLSALAQGILAGVGYMAVGFDSLFLLIFLTTIFAMIPFVGAAAVWVPCCLFLFFVENRVGTAIGLAVWGFAVVSMADNIIKPLVLHGQSNLHPLLALLSVIGGVSALGPIGILVGPMLVAFLQALLNILRKELNDGRAPAAE